jgi:hypothetical protein
VEPAVQLLDRRITLPRWVICGATSAATGQETHTAQAGDLWNYQCSYQTGVILLRRVICGATSAAIGQETYTAQASDLWSHQSTY